MAIIAVFDLDGTLIDSMPSFSAVMKSIPQDAGFPADDALVDAVTPLGYLKSAEYFAAMGVPATVEDILKTIDERLYRAYSETIVLKEGVFDMLHRLSAEGARLFVLTASPHRMTDTCLKRNGVFDLFEEVWSVDDFGINKTNPALFVAVAERIGCKASDIRFFDDNLTAITTAEKAGVITYGVCDRQSPETIETLKATARYFVSTFKEWNV